MSGELAQQLRARGELEVRELEPWRERATDEREGAGAILDKFGAKPVPRPDGGLELLPLLEVGAKPDVLSLALRGDGADDER